MSDNFRFDLTGVPLDLALEVAFLGHKTVTRWSEEVTDGKSRLILYWADCDNAVRLPAPMDAEQSAAFIKAWLSAQSYGREPDHDGDNSKGFRIYNEEWGHVAGKWQAFVAIEPVWLMYGK